MISNHLIYFLKGIAIGAANVIPGVSGGTIAFITGIYERLITALKSFDLVAFKLIVSFEIKEFSRYVDLGFLMTILLGLVISLLTLGRLLDILFAGYPVYVWAFFFGLIAWSVYSVGKTVKNYSIGAVLLFIIGSAIAILLALATPAFENPSFVYLIICGVVAIASMILPGLSGSFVLILMGNYRLIMLQAIPQLNFTIIFPVMIGVIIGFIILPRLISFLLSKYKDLTVSLLAGFILGSLLIIWPWKSEIYLTDTQGVHILKEGTKIIEGYNWFIPEISMQTILAIAFMIVGGLIVYLMDKYANKLS